MKTSAARFLIALFIAACGPQIDDGSSTAGVTTAEGDAGVFNQPDAGGEIADAGNVEPVEFARDVQPILDGFCISCHRGSGSDVLDLRGPGSKERLLARTLDCFNSETDELETRKLIDFDTPERSALWHKIANVNFDCGREMPPTGRGGLIAIDRAAFDVVDRWIREGTGR